MLAEVAVGVSTISEATLVLASQEQAFVIQFGGPSDVFLGKLSS